MNNNVLRGICKSRPNLIRIVLFGKRTGGTYGGALAAGDTGSIVKRKIKRLTDRGIHTAVVCADYANVLLLTGCNASAAEDTFVVIPHDGGRKVVNGIGVVFPFIGDGGNIQRIRKLTQFAVAAAFAEVATGVMVGEDQFHNIFSGPQNSGGFGEDGKTFAHRIHTGGLKRAIAFQFRKAAAAGADLIHFFQITEGGNMDAIFPGSL